MAETNKTAAEEQTKNTRKRTTKTKADVPVADQSELVKQNELLRQSNELLMQKLNEMQAQIENMKAPVPQMLAYPPDAERVNFYWEAPVSDENEVAFGPQGLYGQIVGKTGSFSVPKNELSRMLTAEVRSYLKKRWLIVLSGLTDEERDAMGVDYTKGEVLDRKMFRTMVDNGEKLVEIFPDLCQEHKEIVAKTFYETWMEDPKRISKEVVTQLYRTEKSPAFKKILEGMNAQELDA